jgi:tRNA G26 N,N-dimethylase Trm1
VLGPIWNKSLYDDEFIKKAMEELEKNSALFKTHKKVNGYLSVLSQVSQSRFLHYSCGHENSLSA